MASNIIINNYYKGFELGALLALAIFGEAMSGYRVSDVLEMIKSTEMSDIVRTGYDAGLLTYIGNRHIPFSS